MLYDLLAAKKISKNVCKINFNQFSWFDKSVSTKSKQKKILLVEFKVKKIKTSTELGKNTNYNFLYWNSYEPNMELR